MSGRIQPDDLIRPMWSRRAFVRSLCASLPVFSFDQLLAGVPLDVQFVNVAREAGSNTKPFSGRA